MVDVGGDGWSGIPRTDNQNRTWKISQKMDTLLNVLRYTYMEPSQEYCWPTSFRSVFNPMMEA